MWFVLALSGPILWAASTHLDKYLVEKYFKDSDVAVLLVFTALIGLVALPAIWFFDRGATFLPWGSAAVMALAGALYMGAMVLYLRALQSEEASVVAPFYQASPLFGYVLGYFVLGERLSSSQLEGGALIVGGAALASVRWKASGSRVKLELVGLMLACAFILASTSLIFKIFALHDDFWPTTFWMYAGEALFGVALLAINSYRRQFFDLFRLSPGAVLSVNAANELINLGGGLGTRYALLLAPLSLVQAVGSTTTLFVFLFGILLSVFFPGLGREELSRPDLIQKGGAAILVAAGTALVTW
jgi:uncharacterized membrane protein